MKLKLEIEMDNAAFREAPNGTEAARILRMTANKLEMEGNLQNGHNGFLRDYNGNTVGYWKVTR